MIGGRPVRRTDRTLSASGQEMLWDQHGGTVEGTGLQVPQGLVGGVQRLRRHLTAVLVNHTLVTETLGAPEDLPAAVEPEPPLVRITQQNPGTDPVFGVLMICAGYDPAARIGTITPVYGALGCRPGSAARGRFVGPLTLTGQGWRGT